MTSRDQASARTIQDAVAAHAIAEPGRIAIASAGLPTFSFSQLNQRINEIGDNLRKAGIGASSRVGILLPNGPEAAIVAIGISANAIGFPLSFNITASQLDFELTRSDLDAVVLPNWTDLQAATILQSRAIGIFHASKATMSLEEIGLELVTEIPVERQRAGSPTFDSVCVIQMSSGSTGIPKLILVTHANLFDIAAKIRAFFGVCDSDRSASLLPISVGFAFKISLVAPLLLGSSIAISSTHNPQDVSTWTSQSDPTWFAATPTFLNAALDRLRSKRGGELKHALRFFASTSAYLPETVRTGLEEILGIQGLEFYGLREAGIVAANPAAPAPHKPGSVGAFFPEDVAILAEDGSVLPVGVTGAIGVRGPGISPGYIEALSFGQDRVGNSEDSGDWTLTGDLGVVDEDGFLWIVGRAKEIINRGGEKFSPYEVEKVLLQHPQVREASAFSVPHPRLGENVAAAVVLEPGSITTPSEVKEFLRSRLASYKIPQRVDIVLSLPKSSNGKVLRNQVREASINRRPETVPPQHLLEHQIADIWRRLLDRTDIGVHDDFFEAGGDSLLATQMLVEVEVLVGHRVSQAALAHASTIRQLTQAAVIDGGIRDELVTKASDGSGTPLFFCHGDATTRGFYALRLAKLLEPNHPVYLLHPFLGVDHNSDIETEALASMYVPLLLETRPRGSFRLGGYCNGGALAWEIANQLVEAGREVDFVVLLETVSFNARYSFRFIHWLVELLALSAWSKSAKRQLEGRGMRAVWDLVLGVLWDPRFQKTHNITSKCALAFGLVYRSLMRRRSDFGSFQYGPMDEWGLPHSRALANYVPPAIACDIVWMTCDQSAENFIWSATPWKRLGRKFHCLRVPGEHQTCITRHIENLAEILSAHLSDRFPTVGRD